MHIHLCRSFIFTVAYALWICSALRAHKPNSVRTLHTEHIRRKVFVLTLFTWLLWISLARWRWLSSSLWIPSSSSTSFFFRRRCGGVLYIFMKPFRGRLSIKRKIKSSVQLRKCPWSLKFSRAKYERRVFRKSRNGTNFWRRDESERVFHFEEQKLCKFLFHKFLFKIIISWGPFSNYFPYFSGNLWLLSYYFFNRMIFT